MAEDAVGLLHYLAVGRAHIIGASMDGLTAQILGIKHPRRVRSLGLMITTPGLHDENLSRTPSAFLEEMLESAILGIKGKTIEATLGIARAYHGPRFEFDELKVRQKAQSTLSQG